jgi:hypothetical protein
VFYLSDFRIQDQSDLIAQVNSVFVVPLSQIVRQRLCEKDGRRKIIFQYFPGKTSLEMKMRSCFIFCHGCDRHSINRRRGLSAHLATKSSQATEDENQQPRLSRFLIGDDHEMYFYFGGD